MPPAHRRHAAELLQHLTSHPLPSYTGFITDGNECSMNTYAVYWLLTLGKSIELIWKLWTGRRSFVPMEYVERLHGLAAKLFQLYFLH